MAAVPPLTLPSGALSSLGAPTAATQKDLIVSVVVPVYNKRAEVAPFAERARRVLQDSFLNFELIFADDSSTDGTVEVVRGLAGRDPNIRLLVLSRHYGTEIALTAGLDAAIGDFVVIMSPQLNDPPELIPALVSRAQDGFDVVYVRKPAIRAEAWPYRFAVRAFYWLSRRLTGLDMREDATPFQVLSRRVVNSLGTLKEHNRFMRMLFAYVGYNAAAIEPDGFIEAYRGQDDLRQRIQHATDAIIAFSDKPLRYASVLALGLAGLALAGALALVAQKVLSEDVVAGWTSLMVVQLIMFCLLFFFLAVISEYVSRILIESKNRPLYYIREDVGGTQLQIENIVELD